MKKIEILYIGLNELRSNLMRTSLTMLGIIFGVASVIAMLSIGEGARQETIEQIELMGTNNIIINRIAQTQQISTKNSKRAFSPGLSLKDAEAIEEINPFIELTTPLKIYNKLVTYKSTIVESKIIGTTENYALSYNSQMQDGSFFNKIQNLGLAYVCVIGSGVKDSLFRFENPMHKKIKIGTNWFEIIGITGRKNASEAGQDEIGSRDFNNDIYIPFQTMVYKMEKPKEKNSNQSDNFQGIQSANVIDRNSIDQLSVKVRNSDDLKESAELIRRILNRKHYGVKDYEVVLPEQLLEQKQKTQKIFNIVMGAIAGISLLVGGIGIMNIMLANILERTREIGVRRAIGATRMDLINQFIYESIIISVAGGLLGIVLGFILTSIIAQYAEWRTIITPFSVILSFFVSAAVGVGFGFYPAKKAADKDPIEALRYE